MHDFNCVLPISLNLLPMVRRNLTKTPHLSKIIQNYPKLSKIISNYLKHISNSSSHIEHFAIYGKNAPKNPQKPSAHKSKYSTYGQKFYFFNFDNLFVVFLSVHTKSVSVHPNPLYAYPLLLSVNSHKSCNNKFLYLCYNRKNTRFFRISPCPF